MHAVDEIAQHLLADLEVGDDAVLERPDRLNVRRRTPDHPLRLGPHGQRAPVFDVDGDHGRLVEDDATAADVHQRVGGSEVDSHVSTKEGKAIFGHSWSSPEKFRMAAGKGRHP